MGFVGAKFLQFCSLTCKCPGNWKTKTSNYFPESNLTGSGSGRGEWVAPARGGHTKLDSTTASVFLGLRRSLLTRPPTGSKSEDLPFRQAVRVNK